MRSRSNNRNVVTIAHTFIFKWRFRCRSRHYCVNPLLSCAVSPLLAGNKTSRGLNPKCDRKACMYCLAGRNCYFQSQLFVSQPPSFFFVQLNDPNMLCDRFIDTFKTHSFTREFCYRRIMIMISTAVNQWIKLAIFHLDLSTIFITQVSAFLPINLNQRNCPSLVILVTQVMPLNFTSANWVIWRFSSKTTNSHITVTIPLKETSTTSMLGFTLLEHW